MTYFSVTRKWGQCGEVMRGFVTIVPLSTTPQKDIEGYHYKLFIDPVLPEPYNAEFHWVKADMVYTVSLDRLYLPFFGVNCPFTRSPDVSGSGLSPLRWPPCKRKSIQHGVFF